MNNNKTYSVLDSVEEALQNNKNPELQAELYLCTCRKHPLGKRYKKFVIQIAKYSIKRNKLAKKLKKKKTDKLMEKLGGIETELVSLLEEKNEIITKMVESKYVSYDSTTIAKCLISRYHGGIKLKDTLHRILSIKSAYGRFMRTIYKDLCPCPIWKKTIILIKREKIRTSFEKDRKAYWNDKQIIIREQALAVEQAFVLYLLNQAIADFSEDELRQLIDEIANEIEIENRQLAAKIKTLKNAQNIAEGFSKAIIQIVRLSVGKAVFLNASVKVTNVMLRAIVKKGMTYPQNAVFRKCVVRLLGKGRINIILTLLTFLPDIFALFHRRDRANVVTAIILMNQMRYSNESLH